LREPRSGGHFEQFLLRPQPIFFGESISGYENFALKAILERGWRTSSLNMRG
jgi:hypothetical protein